MQTEFAIKLVKFDDGSKVKLIKEIKVLLPEMNLVQVCVYINRAFALLLLITKHNTFNELIINYIVYY